jgi:hypothetical protein
MEFSKRNFLHCYYSKLTPLKNSVCRIYLICILIIKNFSLLSTVCSYVYNTIVKKNLLPSKYFFLYITELECHYCGEGTYF